MKRTQEKLLEKVPSCSGDHSVLEMPLLWDNCQGQKQLWNGVGLCLEESCITMDGRDEEMESLEDIGLSLCTRQQAQNLLYC